MNALPARLGRPRTPVPSSTFEVVARLVNRSTLLVQQLLLDSTVFDQGTMLYLGPIGTLRFDEPFAAIRSTPSPAWQATARLHGCGLRFVRYARVELEVAAWSDDASELRLRPVSRRVTRWAPRRQRRYFALAHRAADVILELLTASGQRHKGGPTKDFGPVSPVGAAKAALLQRKETEVASIRKEALIDARPEDVWTAVRDFGAVHERLAPGFIVDTRLDGDARIVTFFNGAVAREQLVDIDDEARRLVYSVVESPLGTTHHNASAQVFADGDGKCRFVWITDVLPHHVAARINELMDQGIAAIERTLASEVRPAARSA
jgi:hypothetical protein